MNFKNVINIFSWMHPIGEYALKLCFCLFNKKTCALLISFFYMLCMEAQAYMGSTKFKCESLGIVNLSNCESTGPL